MIVHWQKKLSKISHLISSKIVFKGLNLYCMPLFQCNKQISRIFTRKLKDLFDNKKSKYNNKKRKYFITHPGPNRNDYFFNM